MILANLSMNEMLRNGEIDLSVNYARQSVFPEAPPPHGARGFSFLRNSLPHALFQASASCAENTRFNHRGNTTVPMNR